MNEVVDVDGEQWLLSAKQACRNAFTLLPCIARATEVRRKTKERKRKTPLMQSDRM